jgi:hypothetical protein
MITDKSETSVRSDINVINDTNPANDPASSEG